MKSKYEFPLKIALVLVIWLVWWGVTELRLTSYTNLALIFGGILLTYPLVWVGRLILDQQPTAERANWVTTFVHFGLGFTFGIPIVQAVTTHRGWQGWTLAVPEWIGLVLVLLSAAAFLLTVINLAMKGSGAPFFIALSQKVARDWMYAWTRNPMGLAAIALLVSLGLWYQSALFLVWGLLFFTPAFLYFIKVFEERELELRLGDAYLEYRARTPMLIPRKPKR
jgi:protein-S-isoprenylcysteine O-methyltransferase Ste14